MIDDIIRSFLWGILSALLWLSDQAFTMMKAIALVDVSEIGEVWAWWSGLISFVVFFMFIRLIAIVIKSTTNEEFKEKVNGVNTLIKVFLISAAIGFFPIAMKYITSTSVYAISTMSNRLGYNVEQFKPSTFIINTSMAAQAGTSAANLNYNINLDINEKENGKYKFFPTYDKLFILIGIGIVASFGFIIAAIQIASRIFTLIMKVLISPLPISALLNPEDQSFKMYVRMCISDVITNYVQILMVIVILGVSGNPTVARIGALAQMILLIGGIMVLTKGMHELAQLIGGDVAGGSVLQQIAAIRQSSAGVGRGMAAIGGGVAGAALTAGALGAYSAGRAMGKESLMNGIGSTVAQSGTAFGATSGESSFKGGATAQENNKSTTSSGENLFKPTAPTYNSPQNITSASPDLDFHKNRENHTTPDISSSNRNFLGRFAKTVGNHIYEASGNRLKSSQTMMRARNLREVYRKVK